MENKKSSKVLRAEIVLLVATLAVFFAVKWLGLGSFQTAFLDAVVAVVAIIVAIIVVVLDKPLSSVQNSRCPPPLLSVVESADLEVVNSVVEFQNRLIQMLHLAKFEILLETSGFSSLEIENLLTEKLSSGVSVKIIISPPEERFRSPEKKLSRSLILKRLKGRGAEIRSVSNTFLKFVNPEPFPENHRKLCVIDGGLSGYVGNANFSSKKEGLDFGLFLKGENAKALRNIFLVDWRRAGGKSFSADNFSDGTAQLNSFLSVELLGKMRGEFGEVLSNQIRKAEKSIVIAHHDVSDSTIFRSIEEAKRLHPHLSVVVLLGPAHKKRDFFGRAWSLPNNVEARKEFQRLGIDARVMTKKFHHAKVVVIDSEHVFLGSSDLNLRSFDGNLELDVWFRSAEIARNIEELIVRFHEEAPVVPVTLFQKALSGFFHSFHQCMRSLGKVAWIVDTIVYHMKMASGRRILFRKSLRAVSKIGICPRLNIQSKEEFLVSLQTSFPGLRIEVKEVSVPTKIVDQTCYVGMASNRANLLIAGNVAGSYTGQFGSGIYATTSFGSAADYAFFKSRKYPDGSYPTILEIGVNSEALRIPNAEGKGIDYIVIEIDKPISIIRRFDFLL